MFDVKKELLDSHEALLEVVFEDDAVEEAKRQAAREISREINIPGFRRGRAPYTKVVQHVGEATVMQEAAEHLLEANYSDILEQADVSPQGPGEFVDMQTDPLRFQIRVPLEPSVELGDYQSIRESWEAPTVSDEEIEQVLEQLREENAILEPVDRAAEMGDQVKVDVHARVEDEVIVDEHEIDVVLDEDRPFLSPEFVEALVGMSAGEEKSVTLTLPDTVEQPSLQGAEADFDLEVTQVFDRSLPDLDDALASTVGSFESMDELRQDINDRILSSKQEQAETTYRASLVDQLVEQAEIEYPPQMVEETLDNIVEETRQQIQRRQQMSLEDALRLEGRTLEQFREQMLPQAERRLKQSLVLAELARQESIGVSDDEVVQSYNDLFARMGIPQTAAGPSLDIDSDLGRSLRSQVMGQKVMERLASIGRGEVVEANAEDEEQKTAEPGPEAGWPSTAEAPPQEASTDETSDVTSEAEASFPDEPAEVGGESDES